MIDNHRKSSFLAKLSDRRLSLMSKKSQYMPEVHYRKQSIASRPSEGRLSILSKHFHEVHFKPKTKSKIYSVLKYAVSWTVYVLVGSWIFLVLEETRTKVEMEDRRWTRFKDLVAKGNVVLELHELRNDLEDLCLHSNFTSFFDDIFYALVENGTNGQQHSIESEKFVQSKITHAEGLCASHFSVFEEITNSSRWTMTDAIYYTMTLVTTIGFGHISPTTDLGKVFCIVYGLVGVPLTCILMAKTSDLLSLRLLHFYETMKKRYQRHPKMLLGMVTWMFLIMGCFVFMFIPSLVFAIMEGWSHVDAFYFAFITLSTIGFGDYIAGYGDAEPYSDAYKIMIVLWIMASLGYWIFLLNFLQKAIKSNAKTLKKTFQTKNISRQAEFVKQLLTKLWQQEDINEEDETFDERLHMMALIVESLSGSSSQLRPARPMANGQNNTTGPARSFANSPHDRRLRDFTNVIEALWRKPSRLFDSDPALCDPSLSNCQYDDEAETGKKESEEEQNESFRHSPSISFDDLMKVKVSVKTDTLPGFETLVERSRNKNFTKVKETMQEDSKINQTALKEVTITMKDVLSIVLIAASLENELSDFNDDASEISFNGSCSEAANDPRKTVPILRSILVTKPSQTTLDASSNHEECHVQIHSGESTLSCHFGKGEAPISGGIEPFLGAEREKILIHAL